MNASGWLLSVALCVAAFLPALGARTMLARRWLVIAGSAIAVIIGSLAVRAATQSGQGFFPSEAGWALLLIGMPLGAGTAAAGLVLVLTRPTKLSEKVRAVLAIVALLGTATFLYWHLVA